MTAAMAMPPKKKISDIKREAIIEAARHVFLELGVDGAHMNKIAALAQVSKRTVYSHFESKDHLLMYLLGDLWNRGMVKTDIHDNLDKPLNQQLEILLTEEVNSLGSEEYVGLARVAMGHFLFKPGIIHSELEGIDVTRTALYKWIRWASQNGQLDIPDVDFAFSQIQNMLKGSCFWPQVAKVVPILDDKQKHRLVMETSRMFLRRYETRQIR